MVDSPIAHTIDGRPLYDNVPTVVVGLVRSDEGLLVIRRKNDPGAGLYALPGGFHMRGETWREALAREILEETGVKVDADKIAQFEEVVTDEYGHNLIFGIVKTDSPVDLTATDGEVTDAYFTKSLNPGLGPKSGWAFPLHYYAALQVI